MVTGIACFLLGTSFRIVSASHSSPDTKVVSPVAIPTLPAEITIPSIAVHTAVASGGLENGKWILTDSSAFYLPTSGKLNEGYNTVIYAHKLPRLFANLHTVQIGDLVEIKDDAGTTFHYQVYDKQVVKSEELEKIQSTIPNSLTLFTCDGLTDTERLVVRARLV